VPVHLFLRRVRSESAPLLEKRGRKRLNAHFVRVQ